MRKWRERAGIDKNWTYSVASFVRLEAIGSLFLLDNIEKYTYRGVSQYV